MRKLAIVLMLAAGTAQAADQKPKIEPTTVEKAVMGRIAAEDTQASPKPVRNPYCPITGKPVNPDVPPIDCPQKFRHIHLLVGVASTGAAEAYKAACDATKSSKWLVSDAVSHAAANNMAVDLSNPKTPVEKPILLPPEMMAPVPSPKDVAIELTVDDNKKFQTIDGFGTATYAYNKEDHQTYAKPEFQKRVVQDLGLSMIRFEIAPAHFKPVEKPEQIDRKDFVFEGEIPGIPINEKTGKPEYGPVKGTIPCLEFVAAIKKLDPTIKVTPSVWSPPAWMKTNARPSGGGSLKPEYYAHFAQYLVEWVRLVKEKYGFEIDALSPQNELEFVEMYNSCLYKPEEYRDIVKIIGQTFQKQGLNIKLFGPEDMTHFGPRTVRYIQAIEEDPEAKPFLNIIATHGYEDGVALTGSVKESGDFWNQIKQFGKPYWQTETGTGSADGRWNDGGPDGKTETVAKDGTRSLQQGALSSVGGRLHYAMAYGNASAWLFWQICDAGPNNAALMVLDQPTKKYYAAKHFYRWIRPGAVRIAAGPDGGDKGVCVTAYEHEKNKTVTVVLLNRSHDNAKLKLNIKTALPVARFETYRTSEKEDCVTLQATSVTGGKADLTLPPRSIVTLYGTAQ